MRIARLDRSGHRPGTVLPMLAIALTALCAFTALAIDLGMLAVSRTECQNAADAAALIGCRTLNNNGSTLYNNLPKAVQAVNTVAGANTDMGANYTSGAQITEIDAGQYLYNTSSQTFSVSSWTNVTSDSSVSPSSGAWTAIQVTISYTQPMFFLTVLGINSMPTGAVAAAVYRPRDTAFVLDMTGSMAYASQFNYNNGSNNPDTLIPNFGHYYYTGSNCIQNTNQYTSDGQAISQNNYCIYTPDGLPIIRDFVYDPTNIANPSQSAYPITSNTSSLLNAFHRWSPTESGAVTSTYLGPTYNFTGYNAFDTTNTSGPTPAPDNFMAQFDVSGIPYVGDRWPRLDGKVWTTPTSTASNSSGYPYPLYTYTPAWNDSTSGAAFNDLAYLGIATSSNPNPSPPSPPSGTKNSSGGSFTSYTNSWSNTGNNYDFRDPAWETYGYDLIMGPSGTANTYRNLRGSGGTPINPSSITSSYTWVSPSGSTWPNATANPSGATANRYKGYSMGPGYWGKTFFIWPPDPRFSSSASLTSPNQYCPAFDTSGNAMCDWRRRFFLNSSGSAFNPQTTNINNVLFNSGSGQTLSSNTGNYQINYPAVLAWIKSGPQVLPPNLRAGRIVYYSSIPNDVNTSTATGQAQLDKVFWQNYINYVLGYGYTSAGYLYGQADSWSSDPVSINSGSPNPIKYSWETSTAAPYMNYSDSPLRPRLHFWFGPMSMVDFISGVATGANWNPGTCHEAQCWQLKVAMNSVISAVQNNHPNDTLGMVMFAANAYNGPRVAQGQNYTLLQDALFYPFSLINSISTGNVTSEECPYTLSFGNALAGNEIPNANGSTDPNTGLAYAYNLLSCSSQLSSSTYGTAARRGASKMIILETDGVPNTYRGTSNSSGMVLSKHGYDSYYPTSTWSSGDIGDGEATVMTNATNVVQQICAQMQATGYSAGNTNSSGLSLPNAPAYVYPIAFGDLFDSAIAPNATFRPTALQFLANVAYYGGTGTQNATAPPAAQIITGDYTTRISLLQTCFQEIFQSGVTVALVE